MKTKASIYRLKRYLSQFLEVNIIILLEYDLCWKKELFFTWMVKVGLGHRCWIGDSMLRASPLRSGPPVISRLRNEAHHFFMIVECILCGNKDLSGFNRLLTHTVFLNTNATVWQIIPFLEFVARGVWRVDSSFEEFLFYKRCTRVGTEFHCFLKPKDEIYQGFLNSHCP